MSCVDKFAALEMFVIIIANVFLPSFFSRTTLHLHQVNISAFSTRPHIPVEVQIHILWRKQQHKYVFPWYTSLLLPVHSFLSIIPGDLL
jgi:hypothetical protein